MFNSVYNHLKKVLFLLPFLVITTVAAPIPPPVIQYHVVTVTNVVPKYVYYYITNKINATVTKTIDVTNRVNATNIILKTVDLTNIVNTTNVVSRIVTTTNKVSVLSTNWVTVWTTNSQKLYVTNSANQVLMVSWKAYPNVAGYKLYYGTNSGTYKTVINAGNNTSVIVTNLISGMETYFVGTTYDKFGNESMYSPEVKWP
jgi:hypothetical protein